MLVHTIAKELDPYIPMQQGTLKNTRIIDTGTDMSITYQGPYARFLYYGRVMVGVRSGTPWAGLGERKRVTQKELTFHGAPQRGAFWDVRMWADRKHAITKIIDKVAKAKGGR